MSQLDRKESTRPSKEELIADISELLGIVPLKVSTGSTEPKELFVAISDLLGLAIPCNATKPEMARQIVEFSGGDWTSSCESRGGTVTRAGLLRVRDAVVFFTSQKMREQE